MDYPGYTDEQGKIIDKLFVSINSVSLIFGALTVIVHKAFKKNLMGCMSLHFSVATTVVHAALLVGPIVGYEHLENEGILCQLQGAILQTFTFSSVLWIFFIAFELYLFVVWEYNHKTLKKSLLITFHAIAWGLPLLTALILLGGPGMTHRNYWCWVKPDNGGVWQWACFYGPIVISLILVAIFWTNSIIKVSQYIKRLKTKAYITQSIIAVFIFFASYILQFAHRVYNVFDINYFGFEISHVISLGSSGILCFFVYGLTHHNITECKRACGARSNEEESQSILH